MALSGTLNSTAYDGRYIQLTWTATQDITNNTSTISWTLKGAGTGSVNWYLAGGFKVVIDGATVYSVSTDTRIKLYDDTVVASGTKTITHNSDGTRNFSAYIEAGIYTFAVNCSGSGSFTLNTIPRASTLSVRYFTMGSAGTITISRASSSFTHTIKYHFGSASGTIATKTSDTSVYWTPSLDLATMIPNNTSGVGTLVCETYNGSSLIGSTSINFTCNVPSDIKPTVTLSISEAVDDVKTKLGVYVKDLSKLSIKATGSGAYGSTISAYFVSANGTTYNSASVTTGLLTSSGNMTINATVTDSRGRIGSTSITINVKDYIKPYITSFNVVRCDASGNESEDDSYFKATYNLGVTDISGNAPTYTLKYKKKSESESSYTSVILATSGSTLSGSKIINNIDVDSSYDVVISVSDQFNNTTIASTLSTAYTIMDFHSSGQGIAIGKVSEGPGLDVAMDTTFRGSVNADLSSLFKIKKFTYSDTALSVNANSVSDTLFDISEEGYTPLGVVGVHTAHGGMALIVSRLESNTQAKLTARNVTSNSIAWRGQEITILYLKTTI